MATRAIIQIEGIKYAQIYKHYDGYPDGDYGMLNWLEDFNTEFYKYEGDRPDYKFAQLLRHSTKYFLIEGERRDSFLGWGVRKYGDNGDVEYIYTLKRDGSVTYISN